MAPSIISRSSLGSRITDLVVLTMSFLLFVLLMGIELTSVVLVDLMFYVAIVFVCLRLARRAIFEYLNVSKRIFNILLGNISGLVTGGVIVSLASMFITVIDQWLIVVALASILAFFILGTLSPLIRSSHSDKMIHH